MNQDQNVSQAALIAPEIAVPFAVQEAIKNMHKDLVSKAQAFETSRGAFGEYLRVTRRALQVPETGHWELREDASSFVKLEESAG